MDKQTIRFRCESASVKLERIESNLYSLRNLWAHQKGKGHGSCVMRKAIAFADLNDIAIMLVVSSYGQAGLTDEQLERFYKRLGFEVMSGTRGYTHMIRKPSYLRGNKLS